MKVKAAGRRGGRALARKRAGLGKVLLSVMLAVSLMPAYAAFGNETVVDVVAAQEQSSQSAEARLAVDEGAAAQLVGDAGEDAEPQAAATESAETESAAGEDAATAPAPAATTVKQVAKPSAQTGLTYTGAPQTGVAAGEGYSLAGTATATNAGNYEATATLEDGYAWFDGTTDDVTVSWSIARATLTATYAGETVSVGTEPALGIDVEGFVAGETPLTAAGYKAPSVTAPSLMTAGTYELTPAGGTAANYDFVYVAGALTVEDPTTGSLKAGTYAITANLSMPGEYNPVIPGATVYANNPNNPFTDNAGASPVLDGNSSVGVQATTPTSPLKKNAKLVVAADGSKTLELDILNPVFTTQEMGTCAELPDVNVTRKAPADASVWSYGSYGTRISHVSIKLTDDLVTGSKSYFFKGSKLYAVPLSMDIAPTGDIALELSVNYSSLPAEALPDNVTPTPDPDPDPDPTPTPDGNSNADNGNNNSNGNTGDAGGSNSDSGSGSNSDIASTSDGHIAAGTYTVSANLWFDKATTGLPLNPHMTNGGFPPSTPVEANATMTVDSFGHATVSVPVKIQDKVMTINNVWGGSVTNFTGSTVTLDLGTPSASQSTFTGSCSTSVTIGWLARTIAAGIFNGVWDHTWNTNWEVDLGSALPASGGGELPAEAQAILDRTNGVSTEAAAKDAALAAAESATAAAASGAAKSGAAKGSGSASASASEDGAQADLASAAASNPALTAGIVIGCLVVLAAAGFGIYTWRKKKTPQGKVADHE